MSTSARDLRTRFAPLLEQVRASTLQHEAEGSRPHAEVRLLADAGFGRLRLPVTDGGEGVDLVAFFALLVDLAAADSNQAQIWRNHIAFVEDRLPAEPAAQNRHWRTVLAGGAVVGGAWTEPGPTPFSQARTQLEPAPGGQGWQLAGTKHYSTGSLYADWISVTARRTPTSSSTASEQEGDVPQDEDVIALVDARAPGVDLTDDWAGIGQKATGSGTSVFSDVAVDPVGVFAFDRRAPYQEAVYQLVLLATLAGIARAAQHDVVTVLRDRKRAYPQGVGDVPREDPQLQAVVGRVSAYASAAEASVLRAAGLLDLAAASSLDDDADADLVAELLHEAAVGVYEAQVSVTEDVLAATTMVYDALGSSAVQTGTHLDRHWRNARTVASHNPRVYKERIIGDWYLNRSAPVVYRAS